MDLRTLSLDLRERILAAYDHAAGTRPAIAHRFRVSLGMVKKLLQQRRRTGDLAPRYRFCGRKPMIVATPRSQLRSLWVRKNDLTRKELRAATGLKCSLQAINVGLGKLGLTDKKRPSAPASKTVPPSPGRAAAGASGRWASTQPG